MLVDRELAQQLRGNPGYRVRPLKRVSVRGYDHLQPWLVRRRATDDDTVEGGYDEDAFDERRRRDTEPIGATSGGSAAESPPVRPGPPGHRS